MFSIYRFLNDHANEVHEEIVALLVSHLCYLLALHSRCANNEDEPKFHFSKNTNNNNSSTNNNITSINENITNAKDEETSCVYYFYLVKFSYDVPITIYQKQK